MALADINIYTMMPISFITSAIMGWFIIPYVLFISLKKRLFDRVDDRKLHKRAVPRLGGIIFFPIITFATSITISLILGTCNDYELGIFSGVLLKEWLLLCCGLILIYLIGTADDLDGVRYRNKFIVQIVAALFIPFGNIYINNLYGICGIYEIPSYIGIPLTTLLIVFVTNAINLIDGVDGLASGLSSIAFIAFTILFLQTHMFIHAIIALAGLGVLLPFMYYNMTGKEDKYSKIFMGDTGSLTLGFLLSFLGVRLAMYHPNVPIIDNAIIYPFCILFVPIFDAVRVMVSRSIRGKNMFKPDRAHIHHKILDLGFSHIQTTSIICTYAICMIFFNIILKDYININLLIVIDLLIGTIINQVFNRLNRHKKSHNKKKAKK